MSVVNDTIMVENRLEEMFAYLPDMVNSDNISIPVKFEYGDKFSLIEFLKTQINLSTPYPLIWLVTPYVEKHKLTEVQLIGLTFIIAVETNNSMLPKQRMKETMEKVLIPLLNNMKLCFMRANIMNNNRNYDIIKYYNYSGDNEDFGVSSETGDIWDAIKVSFDCTINGVCLKPIKI